MKSTLVAEIRALREMNVSELHAKYREVFEEEPRSRNKDFLWRRIAWRIQALEQGDISERALHRAAELARDADVRVRAPRGAFESDAPGAVARTHLHAFKGSHDARLPVPGTILTRVYRGRTIRVTVLDRGFEHEGCVYRSLTALTQAITGAHWNGFEFFGLRKAERTGTRGGNR
ncbi:MAG: DUF2924 domain-containing protein [Deltaproteobacteria bacterium]|nr:DUF2924 domain-containing protein [Deltaproteobacteria bacterium]